MMFQIAIIFIIALALVALGSWWAGYCQGAAKATERGCKALDDLIKKQREKL